MLNTPHLNRSRTDALLGGVCAGLARYTGVDPVLIRLTWVLAAFVGGTGLLMYLIAWIVIPDETGHHTFMPLLLLGLVIVPVFLGLLYMVPVRVITTP